jgi:hypothetical protein
VITLIDKNGNRHDYSSNSYLILVVDGDRIKAEGDIGLDSLAPILMKIVAQKFSGRGS